ncbi:MAG: hypothetical protein SPL42_03475 [Bacteroidales bacterium]|nr:hypothetical protein [Bacteroidales bacterium]
MKRILTILVLQSAFFFVFPQKNPDFRALEDSLVALRDRVMTVPDEETRISLNEDFMTMLEGVLNMPNSFRHSWDSARNFSVLTSPDNNFKIFTWHIVKDDLETENFGFVHVYNEGRKKYVLYPLYDKRGAIDYPKTLVGNHNRWYGAVYYRIIPVKAKNTTYYTLLGWNGNDIFTNQKIIEILHFNKEMTPIFGGRVFKDFPEKVSRVIFEYSKNATMHLDYENQEFLVSTGRYNPQTRDYDYKRQRCNMIIFEELIPMDESMPSVPAFIVPESSLNQGFVEEDGKWRFLKNVRGSNPDKVRAAYQHKNRNYYQVQ